MVKKAIIFVILLCAFLTTGCTDNGNNNTTATQTTIKTVDVSIDNSAFTPASLQIATGDTVKWTNNDAVQHNVKGATFYSNTLNKGDSYAYTFVQKGVYDYICNIHPSIQGKITVV